MIRHIVAFRFRPTTSEEGITALLEELEGFPSKFPNMKRWYMGTNISQRDQTMTHAFSVDFDSEGFLLSYLNSEEHEEFVRERWRSVVEDRIIVSYEC